MPNTSLKKEYVENIYREQLKQLISTNHLYKSIDYEIYERKHNDLFNDTIFKYLETESLLQLYEIVVTNNKSIVSFLNIIDYYNVEDLDIYFKTLSVLIDRSYEFGGAQKVLIYRYLNYLNYDTINDFYHNGIINNNDQNINIMLNYIMSPNGIKKENNNLTWHEIKQLKHEQTDSACYKIIGINNYKNYLQNPDNIHTLTANNLPNLNNLDICDFKDAYLKIVYGISLNEASDISYTYGQYLDKLEHDIVPVDREIFNTLKAICLFTRTLSFSKENILEFQKVCLNVLKKKKPAELFKSVPSMILSNSFINMYTRAYNKSFTKLLNYRDLPTEKGLHMSYIGKIDGIDIIDSGLEFILNVHSPTKHDMTDEYDEDDPDRYVRIAMMSAQKYDIHASRNMSMSVITSDNLGLIYQNHYYYGYNSVIDIITMSPGDAYTSDNDVYYDTNLSTGPNKTRLFIPPSAIGDEARYGYDEVFSRIAINDSGKKDKKKPDFIVDVNHYFNSNYNPSIEVREAARSFGVPIVMIPVVKIREYHYSRIEQMKKILFSKSNTDPSLIKDIICLQMNLYTGNLTNLLEERNPTYHGYVQEFKKLLQNIETKLDSFTDDNLKLEWYKTLQFAYLDEKRKFTTCIKINEYHNSVRLFLLDYDGKRTVYGNTHYSNDDDLQMGKYIESKLKYLQLKELNRATLSSIIEIYLFGAKEKNGEIVVNINNLISDELIHEIINHLEKYNNDFDLSELDTILNKYQMSDDMYLTLIRKYLNGSDPTTNELLIRILNRKNTLQRFIDKYIKKEDKHY